MTTTQTVQFPNEVAQQITAETWTKGFGDWDGTGPTCLHGHIRRCTVRPGDDCIISAVFIDEDAPGSMEWNDSQDSFEPVRDWAAQAEVTDEMLAETFGPQWRNIVALVRRIATLTIDEIHNVEEARDATQDVAGWTAQSAIQDAIRYNFWNRAWFTTWRALIEFIKDDPILAGLFSFISCSAAQNTVRAIVAADLVDPNTDWTEKELNMLLAPFREVVGDPLEPDTVEEWLQIGA